MATCSICKKEIGLFSRAYTCLYCGKTLCKSCRRPLEITADDVGYLYKLLEMPHADIICASVPLIKTRKDVSCNSCYSHFTKAINEVKAVIASNKKIELLPITYHGKRNTIGTGIPVSSNWHEDWDDCDEDLIALAIYHGCDCVMEIEKYRDTETYEETKDNGKGTYTRTVSIWQKEGMAYKIGSRTNHH